jgi:ABC-type phosphate/phosphonate transport system substrate-binding protein
MIPRRFTAWCLASTCLLAVALPAAAQKKGDSGAIQFRIYGSVLAGISKSDALGSTKPMLDLIGRQVGERFDCAIEDGTTSDDLFRLGKKLQGGEVHLAALWGIEYGWLREKHPQLKVLGVVSLGDEKPVHRAKIYVSKTSQFKKLADLKGKCQAVYKDATLMDRFSLQEMIRAEKHEPAGFFEKTAPYASVRQAVAAVKDGTADFVVINIYTYLRLQDFQPGLANSLAEMTSGDVFPTAVVVGFPALVDKFKQRKGLWGDLQDQFLNVHRSTEGKECINFWRFQFFVKPNDDFQKQVDEAARKYPEKRLLTLE